SRELSCSEFVDDLKGRLGPVDDFHVQDVVDIDLGEERVKSVIPVRFPPRHLEEQVHLRRALELHGFVSSGGRSAAVSTLGWGQFSENSQKWPDAENAFGMRRTPDFSKSVRLSAEPPAGVTERASALSPSSTRQFGRSSSRRPQPESYLAGPGAKGEPARTAATRDMTPSEALLTCASFKPSTGNWSIEKPCASRWARATGENRGPRISSVRSNGA